MNKAIASVLVVRLVDLRVHSLIVSLMEGSVILNTGCTSHNKCCPGKNGNLRKCKIGSCNAN